MQKLTIALVALLGMSCPHLVFGDNKIVVDFANKSTDPEFPVVNRIAVEGVRIQIKDEGAFTTRLNIPTVERLQSNARRLTEKDLKEQPDVEVSGRFLYITFDHCNEEIAKAHGVPIVPGLSFCPFAVPDLIYTGWKVFTKDGSFALLIHKFENNPSTNVTTLPSGQKITVEVSKEVDSYSVTITVLKKQFDLDFSAGFSFFPGAKDRRYRVNAPAAEGDTETTFTRVSDGQAPYQVAAFANYNFVETKWRWLSFSAGLASDVPLENLSIMAGVSFALQTLPVVNTARLTVGGAYAHRKELKPDFEKLAMIPTTSKAVDLTEDKGGFSLFFGISFGFLGGEDKFKGVVAGSGKK